MGRKGSCKIQFSNITIEVDDCSEDDCIGEDGSIEEATPTAKVYDDDNVTTCYSMSDVPHGTTKLCNVQSYTPYVKNEGDELPLMQVVVEQYEYEPISSSDDSMEGGTEGDTGDGGILEPESRVRISFNLLVRTSTDRLILAPESN